MKYIKYIIVIVCLIILCGCDNKNSNEMTIISTSFPGFDFARAIINGSNINVKMLVSPGSETHDYEPTPKDIIAINNSELFIYVGGDSDDWVSNILKDNNISESKIFRLMDNTSIKKEEVVEGMDSEEEDEYDEHVWTSIRNSIEIIEKLRDKIIEIDGDNKDLYNRNASEYINKLKNIDEEIVKIVSEGKRKEIVFGDRFPIRYFADDYDLKYYAAYKGCSHQTEASAKTIAFLINKVKEDKIPVVFKIELSNGLIVQSISSETGAKVLEFNSAHNISKKDFDRGITYEEIMNNNKNVLKEALN